MRMSVQCKSFKWINDKSTFSRNNYIDSWERVSEWNGQINNDVLSILFVKKDYVCETFIYNLPISDRVSNVSTVSE